VNKSPSAVVLEVGLQKSTVTRWKNGSIPTDATAMKLANYFNVSVDYLLGNEQKEKAPSQNEKNPEDITFDDFTYAMHNESGNLSEEDKEILLNLARDLAKHRMEKDKREGK
jgi:transcriptional regulator with XRE-family HTH domain